MKYPRTMRPIFLAAGGASRLARQLDISTSAIYQWRRVPKRHAARVAEITGLTLSRIRPDLFPTGSSVVPSVVG